MPSTPAAVYTYSGELVLFANPCCSRSIANDGSSTESIIAKEVDRISQDIIFHLRTETRYSPFFCSSYRMSNEQYLIDYAVLIRTFVAPVVSNAFPDSCIQWRVQHGQDRIGVGQTMTQFTISRLTELQHGQKSFGWDQVNFRY